MKLCAFRDFLLAHPRSGPAPARAVAASRTICGARAPLDARGRPLHAGPEGQPLCAEHARYSKNKHAFDVGLGVPRLSSLPARGIRPPARRTCLVLGERGCDEGRPVEGCWGPEGRIFVARGETCRGYERWRAPWCSGPRTYRGKLTARFRARDCVGAYRSGVVRVGKGTCRGWEERCCWPRRACFDREARWRRVRCRER